MRKKHERCPIAEEIATVKPVGSLGKKRTWMIVEEFELELRTRRKGAHKSLTYRKKRSERK
jgi:hypothetical protein